MGIQLNGKKNAIMVAAFAMAAPTLASANVKVDVPAPHEMTVAIDHVQLVAYDGTSRVTGRLLGYSDGLYQVETDLGVLRVDGTWVRCEGAFCPQNLTGY